MSKILMLWLLAVAAYAVFLFWYQPWRAPLSESELRDYRNRLQASPMAEQGDVDVLVLALMAALGSLAVALLR